MTRTARPTTSAVWSPRPALLIAFYLALYVTACIPIFSVEILPLSDLPNHLARAYILDHLDTDPLLQKYYLAHWRLFAFQSTDIILPWLTHMLGVSFGQQLFVAATFALLLGGTIAIHFVLFRKVGFWPAAVVLFLYNFPLTGGQVSFMFSTGLGLLLFAAWLASAGTSSFVRVPFFIAASYGLMLCHFFAFSAYALLVMSFALGKAWRAHGTHQKLRILIEAGLPFVVPGICFLMLFGNAVTGGSEWGSIFRKFIVLISPVINYGRWPDVVLALGAIIALWWLNRRKAIKLAPEMRCSVWVLLLAALAMPNLLQGVHAADMRLPGFLAFLLVASNELRLGSRRGWLVFVASVLVLLGCGSVPRWRNGPVSMRTIASSVLRTRSWSGAAVWRHPNRRRPPRRSGSGAALLVHRVPGRDRPPGFHAAALHGRDPARVDGGGEGAQWQRARARPDGTGVAPGRPRFCRRRSGDGPADPMDGPADVR
jgi:hypothetical protein